MALWNEKKGHRATTRNFQCVYPFQSEAGFGARGTYIGQNRLGGAFVFDPWVLYNQGVLTNPNILVAGEIGAGKSAVVKTFIHRQLLLADRRACILDPKGEYGPLARAWGAEPIALKAGGGIRLNPLNPNADKESRQALLLAVMSAALKRDLTPEEAAGGMEALKIADGKVDEPTLPDIYRLLLSPTAEMGTALRMEVGVLAGKVSSCGLALRNLCTGPLAGMFDGPSTHEVDFSKRIVVLDLSAFVGDDAVGILMACASAWLGAEVEEQFRINPNIKNLRLYDEGWRILGSHGVGELLRSDYKLSRSRAICNIMVLHRLSDLFTAGDEGSRASALARGLHEDTGTHIIYRQAPGAFEHLEDVYHFSEIEADVIKTNGRGTGLWMVGRSRSIVHHEVSPDEWPIIDTDQRMIAEQKVAA